MLSAIAKKPITFSILLYWAMFWLLNGLDKFLAGKQLGFLHWFGNQRTEKFTMYFERLDITPSLVTPTLIFAGIIEFAAFALFVMAIVNLLKGIPGAVRLADLAIAASIAVFFGFAVFDVIVGDRLELLEHSTYVGVLVISYLAIAAEVFFDHLRKSVDAPSR